MFNATRFNIYRGNARRIVLNLQQTQRQKSTTPLNLGVLFVPQQVKFEIEINFVKSNQNKKNYETISSFECQQEAWVVERMGKFSRILNPGLNFLIPVIDQVKYVQSLKEIAIGE